MLKMVVTICIADGFVSWIATLKRVVGSHLEVSCLQLSFFAYNSAQELFYLHLEFLFTVGAFLSHVVSGTVFGD